MYNPYPKFDTDTRAEWNTDTDDCKNENNLKKEENLKNENDLNYPCASTTNFVVLVKSESSHDKLCSQSGIAGGEQMPKASQGWY